MSTGIKSYKIEGRKADETMKQFKTRIRLERNKTLKESVTKLTKSYIKKKENLKKLNEKKKNKKLKLNKDENEFYCSEKGQIRPSDMGGIDDFKNFKGNVDDADKNNQGNHTVMKDSSFVTVDAALLTANPNKFSMQDAELASSIANQHHITNPENDIRPPDLRLYSEKLQKDIDKLKKNKLTQSELEESRLQAVNAYKQVRQNRIQEYQLNNAANKTNAKPSSRNTVVASLLTKQKQYKAPQTKNWYASSEFLENNHHHEFY